MKRIYVNIIITLCLVVLIGGVVLCGIFLKTRFEEKNAERQAEADQTSVTTEVTTETPQTETTASAETGTTEQITETKTTETETTEPEETTEKETVDVSMYDNPVDRFLYSITDIDTMILVIGDGYTNNSAVLYYYEKTDGEWECLLAVDAWCGSNGFSNSTYEGDRTTPVGCFEMGLSFGNAPNPGTDLEWYDVNEYMYWVDDNTSEYYDQMIDAREVPPDSWNHGEHLIEYTHAYAYCIFIAVNPPYETSAIFLHCDGGGTSTAGCVGIPEDSMRWVMQNVKTDTRIAIVEHEEDLDHIDELREN